MGQTGFASNQYGPSPWAALLRVFGGTQTLPPLHVQTAAPVGPEVPQGLALMPLGKRVRLAFKAIPATRTEEHLVVALLRLPGADTKTLSDACGWSRPIWHTHFGLMCQKRVAWLWPADLPEKPDAQFLPGMLAEYDAARASFRMKQDVERVFRKMGLG